MLSESLLHKDGAYFLEAAFLKELVEDGKVAPARSRDVPLPEWEDLKELKLKCNEKAYTSSNHPRPSELMKFNGRRYPTRRRRFVRKSS